MGNVEEKIKIFECKKEFELPKWDSDNDCFLEEIVTVENGSVWKLEGSGYICDCEIRLENIDDATWIDISKETLEAYFKDITDDNDEMSTNEYLRSGY